MTRAGAVLLLAVAGGGLAAADQAPGAPTAPTARTAAATTPPPIDLDVYRPCADPATYVKKDYGALSMLLAGYSNAAKLGSALRLGYPQPVTAHNEGPDEGLLEASPTIGGEVYNCFLITMELDDQGRREFPPATESFVSFGFMPITATAHLTQVGSTPLTAVVFSPVSAPLQPWTVVATAQMSLRLSDVKVNGQPLDVGPDCRTAAPLTSPGNPVGYDGLVLTGGSHQGDPTPRYNAQFGGALTGAASIPPFTGCRTPDGEDLDSLLTATVSGPGNDVKLVAGPMCATTLYPQNCTADGGPTYSPLWTIGHGGAVTAAAPISITSRRTPRIATTLTCPDSAVAGTLQDATGIPRGNIGTLDWTIGDCTDASGNAFTVTPEGPFGVGARYYDSTTGAVYLELNDLTIHVTGPAGCTADYAQGMYGMKFASGSLGIDPTDLVLPSFGTWTVLDNTCTTTLFGVSFQVTADYPLDQAPTITSP